jgi:hypothetical protein
MFDQRDAQIAGAVEAADGAGNPRGAQAPDDRHGRGEGARDRGRSVAQAEGHAEERCAEQRAGEKGDVERGVESQQDEAVGEPGGRRDEEPESGQGPGACGVSRHTRDDERAQKRSRDGEGRDERSAQSPVREVSPPRTAETDPPRADRSDHG